MLLPRKPRHLQRDDAPAHPRLARFLNGLRAFDDWRQVLTLRIVVPLILAVVSAYYLTRWAHMNAMPWALAWTIPAALDVSAYAAVTVARHPINRWARTKAYFLAMLCLVLSVAGNIGAHAVDFGVLIPSFYTVAATASVYPLVLVAVHLVAGGMTPRPATREQLDEQAARDAATAALARADQLEAELADVQEELRATRRRRRPAADPAPAQQPAPQQAPAQPEPAAVSDTSEEQLFAAAVTFMRANPAAGRRTLAKHFGWKPEDNRARTLQASALKHIAETNQAAEDAAADDELDDDERAAA